MRKPLKYAIVSETAPMPPVSLGREEMSGNRQNHFWPLMFSITCPVQNGPKLDFLTGPVRGDLRNTRSNFRNGMLSWMFVSAALMLQGEIIDRIAVSVGNQVITENQIEEEVRVTAFQNRSDLSLSTAEKKKAAERLIEQSLVKREMDISRYPLPQLADADVRLAEIRASFGNGYQQKLSQYGIDEAALRRHLWWQLALLRFIEYRFRPGIQLPEQDVREAYDNQAVQWKQQGLTPIPSFEEARPGLEQALVEQRTDQALDRWLGDTLTQVEIRFHEGAFQ